jgi:hypothetical protein
LCFLLLWLSIVRSALFRCDLLFGIQSFLFSSLVPLLGVFPLFIYLSYCSWSFTSAAAESTSSLKPLNCDVLKFLSYHKRTHMETSLYNYTDKKSSKGVKQKAKAKTYKQRCFFYLLLHFLLRQ